MSSSTDSASDPPTTRASNPRSVAPTTTRVWSAAAASIAASTSPVSTSNSASASFVPRRTPPRGRDGRVPSSSRWGRRRLRRRHWRSRAARRTRRRFARGSSRRPTGPSGPVPERYVSRGPARRGVSPTPPRAKPAPIRFGGSTARPSRSVSRVRSPARRWSSRRLPHSFGSATTGSVASVTSRTDVSPDSSRTSRLPSRATKAIAVAS